MSRHLTLEAKQRLNYNVNNVVIKAFRFISERLYSSAVAWTLVFALIRISGNILILPFVLRKLSQEQMGIWYWFISLSGLTALIDMGFAPTMSRVTSYLWAGAKCIPEMGLAPSALAGTDRTPNYELLADLVKTMRLYYYGLGLLATALVGTFGTVWLVRKFSSLPDYKMIVGAWAIFLPAILINCVTGIWHPLLIGINQVRLNQQVQVYGLIANYIVLFIGLYCGAGLYALVISYLVLGASSRLLARAKFNAITQAGRYERSARGNRQLLFALWPTSWRTGLVTMGIYGTLNASILICTAYLGPAVTASLGLSSQLALAAISIATAFIAVKIPLFAQLHAQGRSDEIAPIAFVRMRYFWVTYIALTLTAVVFGPTVLRRIFHSNTPLLPLPLLSVFFIIIGLEGHHGIFREITLTSHRNPFVAPVFISGILIFTMSLILVRVFGIWGLILTPGIVQIAFNNWWTTLIGLRSFGSTFRDYFLGLLGLTNSPRET